MVAIGFGLGYYRVDKQKNCRIGKGLMAIKRVYHFCSSKYALENLEKKRLKISTILDLNDPFELLCHNLADKDARSAMLSLKKTVSEDVGMLCFSASYNNPVQWAHYADKHQGVCLGFDVHEDDLMRVRYSSARVRMTGTEDVDPVAFRRWIEEYASVKYSHWKYEKEHRVFVNISDFDRSQLIFQPIGERIKLRQVIVGCRSYVSRKQVSDALCGFDYPIETFKVRTAFRTFKIVRNKDESFWA